MGSKPKAPGPGEHEKATSRIALQKYSDYLERYVPVEDRLIGIATDPNRAVRTSQDIANVDTQSAFAQEQGQVLGTQAAAGAGTDSGRFGLALGGFGRDRAQALGASRGNARMLGESIRSNNIGNIVRLGQGQEAGAIASIQQSADASQRQALMDARASAASRAALMNTIGTAGGIGAGIYANGGFGGGAPTTPTADSVISNAQSTRATSNFGLKPGSLARSSGVTVPNTPSGIY